jgi:hypothetical protein
MSLKNLDLIKIYNFYLEQIQIWRIFNKTQEENILLLYTAVCVVRFALYQQ